MERDGCELSECGDGDEGVVEFLVCHSVIDVHNVTLFEPPDDGLIGIGFLFSSSLTSSAHIRIRHGKTEDLAHGLADECSCNLLRSFFFALKDEFHLAGDACKCLTKVAESGGYDHLAGDVGATFGIGDHVLHRGDGESRTNAAGLIDVFARASDHRNGLNNLAEIRRDDKGHSRALNP